MTAAIHPKLNDHGKAVLIDTPTKPTDSCAWHAPNAVAVFVPGGLVPPSLAGITVSPGVPPVSAAGWEAMAAAPEVPDPPLPKRPAGKKMSAGAVIIEPDGRIWLFEPTNHFGGYTSTFPKGTVEPGFSLRATAVKEVFEETGLLVRLGAFLIDVQRTTSVARYFVAERIGGSPAAMGWESQALWLAPKAALGNLVTAESDQPILAKIALL